jgi:hypothetical protein
MRFGFESWHVRLTKRQCPRRVSPRGLVGSLAHRLRQSSTDDEETAAQPRHFDTVRVSLGVAQPLGAMKESLHSCLFVSPSQQRLRSRWLRRLRFARLEASRTPRAIVFQAISSYSFSRRDPVDRKTPIRTGNWCGRVSNQGWVWVRVVPCNSDHTHPLHGLAGCSGPQSGALLVRQPFRFALHPVSP